MAKRDYYEVLGVPREASLDHIKKSYRQLALKFHPDKNPGDKASEDQFKEASEAYQVLSDEESRGKYDRFGHAAFEGMSFQGFSDLSDFAEGIFGDIFGAFFGSSNFKQKQGRQRGGRDLRYTLEISLEEAAFGKEKEIVIPKPTHCDSCQGTGAKKGTSAETCRHCGGTGQLRIQQGFFAISRPCVTCGGRGQVIANPCPSCNGNGQVAKEVKLQVTIPAGIDHGQSLKLRGEGEPGSAGAPPGDLFVEISILPHKVFKRQETEIVCEVPIAYAQAVLGSDLEVPTLDGKIMMHIPAGTPSGKVFRLRGKGVIDLNSGRRGDQHVRVYIEVPQPQQLSARQRELLEELATLDGNNLGDSSRGFLGKVKEFFE